jgi:flagellin
VLPADWTPWNEQWQPYTGTQPITLQVGANQGQELVINPVDASTGGLGLGSVDLTTSPSAAIDSLDKAIASVSAMRASFGADANRLEHTISNLQNSQENMSAAESRIRDTDMASEMSNLTRSQIMVRGASAMLAQANVKPQSMLALLKAM